MKNLHLYLLLFLCFGIHLSIFSQNKSVVQVAFYNLENLFDTIDSKDSRDSEYLPTAEKKWNTDKYNDKLNKIARVISEIGNSEGKTGGPDILGVCEVENKSVLTDLIHTPLLKASGYSIIHFDSPDERGIDVAFLYREKLFVPEKSLKYKLYLQNPVNGEVDMTRDQLLVTGNLNNIPTGFIINHWPSRSGGQLVSEQYRIAAATLCRHIIDSIKTADSTRQIIVMGDFNDDPVNISITRHLGTKISADSIRKNDLFNTMYGAFSEGNGTLCYRDKWNLFDQIFVDSNFLSLNQINKKVVFRPDYLSQTKGRYKNYPFRTYAGSRYLGGYSDHFPVYLVFELK